MNNNDSYKGHSYTNIYIDEFTVEFRDAMVRAYDRTADLRCSACGKYLGDNNALIEPDLQYRPTDLTIFCEQTGKNESVIDMLH